MAGRDRLGGGGGRPPFGRRRTHTGLTRTYLKLGDPCGESLYALGSGGTGRCGEWPAVMSSRLIARGTTPKTLRLSSSSSRDCWHRKKGSPGGLPPRGESILMELHEREDRQRVVAWSAMEFEIHQVQSNDALEVQRITAVAT